MEEGRGRRGDEKEIEDFPFVFVAELMGCCRDHQNGRTRVLQERRKFQSLPCLKQAGEEVDITFMKQASCVLRYVLRIGLPLLMYLFCLSLPGAGLSIV